MIQFIIIILSIAADQISKYYVYNWLTSIPGRSYPIIDHVLYFTYTDNTATAMGLIKLPRIALIIIVSLILAVCLIFMLKERKNKSVLLKVALSMIVGGAIGNLCDRIFRSFVVDFIDLRFINFYIFNISDVCICIGAVLLAIYLIKKEKEIKKATNI